MKHIASWSGGKDSTANIILAHENGEPLDLIIFSEVMFDENISGELPEHIDFIKSRCIPLFNKWGYEVKILHSDVTYMDCFNLINQGKKNPARKGMKYGFPMAGKCLINDRCKVGAIRNFFKGQDTKNITQYIGLAIDEPERLARIRISETKKISLLEKYGYIEQKAHALCKDFDLLSPVYDFTTRGGCWFCPNARDCELKHLRNNHRNLWDKLLELEEQPNLVGNIWNTLSKTSIHSKEEQFMWEDRQMTIFQYMDELNRAEKKK